MSHKVERNVLYIIHYKYSWVFDDDSPSGIGDHITNWSATNEVLEATTDREAQLASMASKFHDNDHLITGIEKVVHEVTSDGFERTTTSKVPLPHSKTCPCGKVYWPIKGETACHELITLKDRKVVVNEL